MQLAIEFNTSILRHIVSFLSLNEYPNDNIHLQHIYAIIREHDPLAAEQAWNLLDKIIMQQMLEYVIARKSGNAYSSIQLQQILNITRNIIQQKNPIHIPATNKFHTDIALMIMNILEDTNPQSPADPEYFSKIARLPQNAIWGIMGLLVTNQLNAQLANKLLNFYIVHHTLHANEIQYIIATMYKIYPSITTLALQTCIERFIDNLEIYTPQEAQIATRNICNMIPYMPNDIIELYLPRLMSTVSDETVGIFISICKHKPELTELSAYPLQIELAYKACNKAESIDMLLQLPLYPQIINYFENNYNIPQLVNFLAANNRHGSVKLSTDFINFILQNLLTITEFVSLKQMYTVPLRNIVLTAIASNNCEIAHDYHTLYDQLPARAWPYFLQYLLDMEQHDPAALAFARYVFLPKMRTCAVGKDEINDRIYAATTLCLATMEPEKFGEIEHVAGLITMILADLSTYKNYDRDSVFAVLSYAARHIFTFDVTNCLYNNSMLEIMELQFDDYHFENNGVLALIYQQFIKYNLISDTEISDHVSRLKIGREATNIQTHYNHTTPIAIHAYCIYASFLLEQLSTAQIEVTETRITDMVRELNLLESSNIDYAPPATLLNLIASEISKILPFMSDALRLLSTNINYLIIPILYNEPYLLNDLVQDFDDTSNRHLLFQPLALVQPQAIHVNINTPCNIL